ncbi:DUF6602 domain-containing protein [Devosia sp. SL43]|uniref:DUF6602 domain-containing protein n=1 Tax=Devosia sp. SL43 TaxID=2806348 RepID=UPI001F220A2F|nr:DUF6602 domain-containing protein [Devosia sp. SL43]UJW85275.1 hypothetical protein IM737_18030 [Devosia sp. SL43]
MPTNATTEIDIYETRVPNSEMTVTSTNIFKSAFLGEVRKAVHSSQNIDGLDHQGMKGRIREIVMTDMYRPVLPPGVTVGTGKLVSATGEMSSQIDVVLYAPGILPAYFYSEQGLFPVEAALYNIEVKSILTARGVKEAIASARSVRALQPLPSFHWTTDVQNGRLVPLMTNTPWPVSAMFAFGSDLAPNGQSEIERYRTYDEKANEDPAVQVICVVGRGYWYFDRQGWRFLEASEDLREVMMLLGGTANTIPELVAAKGSPKFGQYLQSEDAQFEAV